MTDDHALGRALEAGPRIVWIETPSNPLLRITDIAAVAKAAHDSGALVAVDNTFLTPGWQNPIDLGADVVVHSTTKYVNGHSDVVGARNRAGSGNRFGPSPESLIDNHTLQRNDRWTIVIQCS